MTLVNLKLYHHFLFLAHIKKTGGFYQFTSWTPFVREPWASV
jgi:hypothetical protein